MRKSLCYGDAVHGYEIIWLVHSLDIPGMNYEYGALFISNITTIIKWNANLC